MVILMVIGTTVDYQHRSNVKKAKLEGRDISSQPDHPIGEFFLLDAIVVKVVVAEVPGFWSGGKLTGLRLSPVKARTKVVGDNTLLHSKLSDLELQLDFELLTTGEGHHLKETRALE